MLPNPQPQTGFLPFPPHTSKSAFLPHLPRRRFFFLNADDCTLSREWPWLLHLPFWFSSSPFRSPVCPRWASAEQGTTLYLSSCILSVNHFLLLEGKYAFLPCFISVWISSFCYSTWLLINTVIIWLIDWLLHFLVPVDWGRLLKNWLASFSPVLCFFHNSWGSQIISFSTHLHGISCFLFIPMYPSCTPQSTEQALLGTHSFEPFYNLVEFAFIHN